MNNRLFARKITLCGLFIMLIALCLLWHEHYPSVSINWILIIILLGYNVALRVADFQIKTTTMETNLKPLYYPHVTIIIPAHNEEKLIEATVLNLLEQDYPLYDVLVMNDRSSDNTATILKTLKQKLDSNRFNFVTRTHEETPGKSAVLNDALLYTQSEYLVIVDADAKLPTNFLRDVIPNMMREKLGAIQVQRKLEPVSENGPGQFLVFCQSMEYALDVTLQRARHKLESAVELRGSGMVVRREALFNTNGWTVDAITDDLDLSSKLHITDWPIGFMETPSILEQGLTHWHALYRQRIRWAQGSLERYLQYGGHLMFSLFVPIHIKLDTIVYSLSLLLPGLFLIDLIYNVATLNFLGMLSLSLSLVALWLIFALSFITCQTTLWQNASFERKLSLSLSGGLYMIAIWMPTIFHAYWRILTQLAPPEWEQTERN